jgi:hypothetical protein
MRPLLMVPDTDACVSFPRQPVVFTGADSWFVLVPIATHPSAEETTYDQDTYGPDEAPPRRLAVQANDIGGEKGPESPAYFLIQ